MALNRGKQWENRFKEDWKTSFPDGFLLRLPDQQSGYFGTSTNICDFIAYEEPKMYLIECKCHEGNTFPLTCLTQYDNLIKYKNIRGLKVIVMLWMIDHKKVFCIPIQTFEKLKEDNKKSFNVKMEANEEYKSILVESEVKRVYPVCNYKSIKEI